MLFFNFFFFFFNTAHKYHLRNEFLHDIELILRNCIVYNGRDSSYSERAEALLRTAQSMLAEVNFKIKKKKLNFLLQYTWQFFFLVQYDEHLTTWEQKIKLVQERAKSRSLSESWYGGDDDQIQEVNKFSYLFRYFDCLRTKIMFKCTLTKFRIYIIKAHLLLIKMLVF